MHDGGGRWLGSHKLVELKKRKRTPADEPLHSPPPPKLCSLGSSVWDQEEVTRVVPMPPALTSTSRPGQPLPPTGFLHQDSHLPPPAQAGLGWDRLQPPTGPVSVPGPSGEGGGPGRGCQSQHTGVCGHGLVWHLRAWFQPTGPGLSLSWVT